MGKSTFGVWLTDAEHQLVKRLAKLEDRTGSQMVRRLILKEARRRKLIEKPARA